MMLIVIIVAIVCVYVCMCTHPCLYRACQYHACQPFTYSRIYIKYTPKFTHARTASHEHTSPSCSFFSPGIHCSSPERCLLFTECLRNREVFIDGTSPFLQYSATRYNTLQHTATHHLSLPHTATHCHTLPHTATHCKPIGS